MSQALRASRDRGEHQHVIGYLRKDDYSRGALEHSERDNLEIEAHENDVSAGGDFEPGMRLCR